MCSTLILCLSLKPNLRRKSTVKFVVEVEVISFFVAGDCLVIIFRVGHLFDDLGQVIRSPHSFKLFGNLVQVGTVKFVDFISLLVGVVPLIFVLP